MSDIIKTQNSYWIIKVTGKKEGETEPIEQVWNKIREELWVVKLNQLRDEWVEELLKKANIVDPWEIIQ